MIFRAAALSILFIASTISAQDVNSFAEMQNQFGGPGLTGKDLRRAIDQAALHPLGSIDNPVRADGPKGQRGYLSRLRCRDGQSPQFARDGNVGPGVFGYFVDKFVVTCGQQQTDVFMDMYHLHVEVSAVPGFSIDGILDTPPVS